MTANGELIHNFSLLSGSAADIAPRILGSELIRFQDDTEIRVKIVEVEAYDQSDIASHSYRGETPRTKVMFGRPGFLYVYFTYGMHYCCNIVVGEINHGAAILIRAVEPLTGIEQMIKNRQEYGIEISNGPAKLCQALAINMSLNGHNLKTKPLQLKLQSSLATSKVTQTTRIGIRQARSVPWRFYITDSPFVSRK
jgi:DNA-3-methyladenine glycosylase